MIGMNLLAVAVRHAMGLPSRRFVFINENVIPLE